MTEPIEMFEEPVGESGATERYYGYLDREGRRIGHGTYEYVSANGRVAERGRLVAGKRDGTWIQYHDNGSVRVQEEYRNGQRHGACKKWFQSGRLECEAIYHNDQLDGERRTYYQDGRKRDEGAFTNGLRSGRHRVWNDQGKIIADGEFVDDVPIEGTFAIEDYATEGEFASFEQHIHEVLKREPRVVEFRNGKQVIRRS